MKSGKYEWIAAFSTGACVVFTIYALALIAGTAR